MSTRVMVLLWLLAGGVFLTASKVATSRGMRGGLLLAALVCMVMMFVTAY